MLCLPIGNLRNSLSIVSEYDGSRVMRGLFIPFKMQGFSGPPIEEWEYHASAYN